MISPEIRYDLPEIRPVTSDTEIERAISFICPLFLKADKILIHEKATPEDFTTYFSSIKKDYLRPFSYLATLDGEIRGVILSIEFNNPALYEFVIPPNLEKMDQFYTIACETNGKLLDYEHCLTLMCIASDLKGTGKRLVRRFVEDFEKQAFFTEFYVEVSNPITMIVISKVLEGRKGWTIRKINEMTFEESIKNEFYIAKYEKSNEL